MVENGWAERKELSQNISIDLDSWILWTLFLDNDQSVKIGWLVSWQVCATERFVFTLLDGVLNVLPADIQSAAAVELCKDVSWADQMFSNKLANWDEVTSWYIMLNPNCHLDLFGGLYHLHELHIWTILDHLVEGETPEFHGPRWSKSAFTAAARVKRSAERPVKSLGCNTHTQLEVSQMGGTLNSSKTIWPCEIYVHVCLFIYHWH